MKIYLAGPHNDDEFRARIIELLSIYPDVEAFDPIAARDFRGKEIDHEDQIVQGDLEDIVSSDVILGNYTVPGWGTGMETWFAYSIHKPIVAYMDPAARVSPWVAKVAGGYANVARSLEAAAHRAAL